MPLCTDDVYRAASEPLERGVFRLVLTRYNLFVKSFRIRAGIVEPNEHKRWLAVRLELFRHFCLPSVVHQVRKPDLWLLQMDGAAREDVAPVLSLIRDHPWIVPAWHDKILGRYERTSAAVTREMFSRLHRDQSHVIMTRLDSDDALNLSFLDDVSRYSAAVIQDNPDIEDFWVAFPIGVQWSRQGCRLLVNPANPFQSRIQTKERVLNGSISLTGHDRIFEKGRVFLPLTTEPMWIQFAHGGNVRNRRRTDLPKLASAQAELARCGITTVPRHLRPGLRLERGGPWRTTRRLAKRLLRSIRLMTQNQA